MTHVGGEGVVTRTRGGEEGRGDTALGRRSTKITQVNEGDKLTQLKYPTRTAETRVLLKLGKRSKGR